MRARIAARDCPSTLPRPSRSLPLDPRPPYRRIAARDCPSTADGERLSSRMCFCLADDRALPLLSARGELARALE